MSASFADGEPNWVDLGSNDLSGAKEFYRALFGWDYLDLGDEAGHYHFILSEGQQVGGLGPIMEPGARPAWTTYFQVADAEAAADAVAKAGGTVRFPPMDVMGQNAIAGFTDPAGGQFAVSQPKLHKGAERWWADNAVCWVEYSARDTKLAAEFYPQVFGWNVQQTDVTSEEYLVLKAPGGEQEFGALMRNDSLPEEHPPYWGIYFAVSDADAVAAKTTDLGGTLLMPPTDMENVGRIAVMTDAEGAGFAILQPAPREG